MTTVECCLFAMRRVTLSPMPLAPPVITATRGVVEIFVLGSEVWLIQKCLYFVHIEELDDRDRVPIGWERSFRELRFCPSGAAVQARCTFVRCRVALRPPRRRGA